MSANEPGLIAQLLAAKSTPAECALLRIVSIYRESDSIRCNEIRVFEIAMEGLGMSSRQIRFEVQSAIQRRRDRVMELRAERKGADDAPT